MKQQDEFLRTQFWANSIAAALQHSGAYRTNTSENSRQTFRERMRDVVKGIARQYENNSVKEMEHINNIETIITASREFSAILNNGVLTFGVAQKMLNLYLKFLWCHGSIREPPHCPLDSRILGLAGWRGTCFTKMNLQDYLNAIKTLKVISEDMTLAQWELKSYNQLN